MIVNIKDSHGLKEAGLWRQLRSYQPTGPVEGILAGQRIINFGSNNYLGLTHHPKVVKAAREALVKYGAGNGASRLISGNNPLYCELERELANIKGAEAALVFATGYQANLGVITALASRNDLILADRLNHASLVDGALLSKAKVKRYPHCDMKVVEDWLKVDGQYRRKFIVTDSVFSMDGDLAPLHALAAMAKKYNAVLIIDDAHGTGVLGRKGAGTAAHLQVKNIPVQIGTLSKALGSLGGFVTGSADLIDYLVNKSRTLIYSTALPPSVLAAATAAVNILREEPKRRLRLRENVSYFKRGLSKIGFKVSEDPVPIIPIIVGRPEDALDISEMLLSKGIFVPAIRPPAIPKDTSRLRITLSACHKQEQMEKLLNLLSKV